MASYIFQGYLCVSEGNELEFDFFYSKSISIAPLRPNRGLLLCWLSCDMSEKEVVGDEGYEDEEDR